MTATTDATANNRPKGPLVYRQSFWTRLTHWLWVICLFFLLFSGLQIFNAHPSLYIGQQSGLEFDNAVLQMYAVNTEQGLAGRTRILGHEFDTTGVFGLSGPPARPDFQGFPSLVTIPSFRDLATGRVVHFAFAWGFVGIMLVWLIASLVNGHFRRDVVPNGADLAELPADIGSHARFRFPKGRRYGPLQKLSYFIVLCILFPLIILTGLTMSPGMDAAWPWLVDLFGGRQTARTIHFVTMVLLVLFFVVHVLMVLLAGPFNELRSMVTGWYRTDADTTHRAGDRP